MKITDIGSRTVLIPIEAPLRHSYGVHENFVRTMVELFTDEHIVGLGETVSGVRFDAFKPVLVGEDPFNLERIHMKISQRGYLARESFVYAPIEFACLDIQSKLLGVPLYKLLGGKIREEVPLSAYLFYRYGVDKERGEVTTPEQMVVHCSDLVERYGFTTLKLKGGVFAPEHDVRTIMKLREHFGSGYRLRLDPNAIWTTETTIQIGHQLEDCGLEYLEDPTWGIRGMAEVRKRVGVPLATNMCITKFDDLAPGIALGSVDIILSDPWYWGGVLATKTLAAMCKALGVGAGMHSGIELGVGLAAMLHVASTIPNLTHAIDSHYHHLKDDVIKGGKLEYKDGSMTPPEGPGLGVELDEDKMSHYAELYVKQSATTALYPHDRRRNKWYPVMPSW